MRTVSLRQETGSGGPWGAAATVVRVCFMVDMYLFDLRSALVVAKAAARGTGRRCPAPAA